jgi:hypothetical protein
MPHFFKDFKKANLKCKKPRKPRNLLDVTKMKPEKMPTAEDIFGKDLKEQTDAKSKKKKSKATS